MTFDSFCTPQAQSLRLPGYQIAYIVWGKLVRVLGIPNTHGLDRTCFPIFTSAQSTAGLGELKLAAMGKNEEQKNLRNIKTTR